MVKIVLMPFFHFQFSFLLQMISFCFPFGCLLSFHASNMIILEGQFSVLPSRSEK